MPRGRAPQLSKVASYDGERPADFDLAAMEAYEPPELTADRLAALAERREGVALSIVPKGLPRVVSARMREAIASATASVAAAQLAITYDTGSRTWRLLNDYSYLYQGHTLTAKQGYAFDLASIPRPLWWLIAPNELSILAPLFHDMLYEYRGRLPDSSYVNPYRTYTRREADDLFLHLMEVEGVAAWRRMAAYSAVRTAGALYWST